MITKKEIVLTPGVGLFLLISNAHATEMKLNAVIVCYQVCYR